MRLCSSSETGFPPPDFRYFLHVEVVLFLSSSYYSIGLLTLQLHNSSLCSPFWVPPPDLSGSRCSLNVCGLNMAAPVPSRMQCKLPSPRGTCQSGSSRCLRQTGLCQSGCQIPRAWSWFSQFIRTRLLDTGCDLIQNRVMGMKPKRREYRSPFVSKGVWTLVGSSLSPGESFHMDLRDVVAPAICLGLVCLLECRKNQVRPCAELPPRRMTALNLYSTLRFSVGHCTELGCPSCSDQSPVKNSTACLWISSGLGPHRTLSSDGSLWHLQQLASFPLPARFLGLVLWLPQCPKLALCTHVSIPPCLPLSPSVPLTDPRRPRSNSPGGWTSSPDSHTRQHPHHPAVALAHTTQNAHYPAVALALLLGGPSLFGVNVKPRLWDRATNSWSFPIVHAVHCPRCPSKRGRQLPEFLFHE